VEDLRSLPERHRSALVMRELSGLSYAEIGNVIEASEGAARQVVYEARESLREVEMGRAMECESVRRLLSERDGRVRRGRRLRAHLGACNRCRDYERAIEQRRADLSALSPPLAPAAASSLLASLVGGSAKGGGALGSGTIASGAGAATVGGGGAAVGGSAALKAASILSVVAIGAGAGVADVGHLPIAGGDSSTPAPAARPTTHAPAQATWHPVHEPANASNHRDTRSAGHSPPAASWAATGNDHEGTTARSESPDSDEPPSAHRQSPPAQSEAATHDQSHSQGQVTGPPPTAPVATQSPQARAQRPMPSQQPATVGKPAPSPAPQKEQGHDRAMEAQAGRGGDPDVTASEG
jgi:hypothetical protein